MSINKAEAREILANELRRFRARSYAELRSLLEDKESYEVLGPSGTSYQVVIQAFWDTGRQNGDLRIAGAIDDHQAPTVYTPLTDSFIIAPDGSFIGE